MRMAGFVIARGLFVRLNDNMQQGIVYLLGAGPGDPGLITVRGRELVETAEVLRMPSILQQNLSVVFTRSAQL